MHTCVRVKIKQIFKLLISPVPRTTTEAMASSGSACLLWSLDQQHPHHLGTFRNTNPQAPPQTYLIKNSGGGLV